jgi:two-component system phosphate regulon sensor histidine kinase PhoR
MKTKRIFWQIFPNFLLLIFFVLSITTWLFSNSLKNFYLDQTLLDLKDQALLIEDQVADKLSLSEIPYLTQLCNRLGLKTGTRITLILPNGKVIADSMENYKQMDNHADRSEIQEARKGNSGRSVRHSYTLHTRMMYVAIPVRNGSALAGFVRTAKPIKSFNETLTSAYPGILIGSLLVAIFAAVISLFLSRRISRPIEKIKNSAEAFANGADTLNLMALRLQDRIDTILSQHNEQEAVLSSMVEGVFAVDTEERILRINQAALSLLDVSEEEIKGKRIQEIIRKADILRFVRKALQSPEPVEAEILIHTLPETYFQAHGTSLKNASGEQIGALIVLNDITHLRRLEKVRRDFVANVSHELKTPITAIKGFVETLLDGALENPAESQRFLKIVSKQIDRLSSIIEDLLQLSRIEQDEEKEEIELDNQPLKEVLNASIQSRSALAEEYGVKMELQCEPDIIAGVDAPLFEQAIANLIDNAIKYSNESNRVLIRACTSGNQIRVSVQDWGIGIDKEHHPRLFERFYRVDKARSRKIGGTGLGLSIVKHIVHIHKGSISLDSEPGRGSTFTIHLPRPS